MSKTKRKRTSKGSRRGTATVEFAVCLPVILVLVLGAIECCSMIFVMQSLHIVAYEGVRSAVRPRATAVKAGDRCNQVIGERKLKQATFTFTPANIENVPRGTPVEVRVTAPTDPNSILKLKFFSGDLEARSIMIKE